MSCTKATTHHVAGPLAFVLMPAGLAVAGPEFGGWTDAVKIDEVAGNHPDVNSTSLDGLPGAVAGRLAPIHGVQPDRGPRRARHPAKIPL